MRDPAVFDFCIEALACGGDETLRATGAALLGLAIRRFLEITEPTGALNVVLCERR